MSPADWPEGKSGRECRVCGRIKEAVDHTRVRDADLDHPAGAIRVRVDQFWVGDDGLVAGHDLTSDGTVDVTDGFG
jgi:hypothetical protein